MVRSVWTTVIRNEECIEVKGKIPVAKNIFVFSSTYKNGDKKELDNYNGISIIQSSIRMFGKIVKKDGKIKQSAKWI